MAFQTVFKRYELKYMLTPLEKEIILAAMSPYMQLDKYGRTTIRNIYFDTDNYRLIRRSIEKPAYKEKLRIRSLQSPMREIYCTMAKALPILINTYFAQDISALYSRASI